MTLQNATPVYLISKNYVCISRQTLHSVSLFWSSVMIHRHYNQGFNYVTILFYHRIVISKGEQKRQGAVNELSSVFFMSLLSTGISDLSLRVFSNPGERIELLISL